MNDKIIIIRQEEHKPIARNFCGNGYVISDSHHNKNFDMAFFNNIRPTSAHYHNNFDEIYTVISGTITVQLYEPAHDNYIIATLTKNEVLMIPAGIHHKIYEASEENCLYVHCLPGFDAQDEQVSGKI